MIRQYTLPSVSGTELICAAAVPEHPRAMLLISHGMAEYIERYEPFMTFLADNGILACGHSHIGHGTAAQKTDTLGYLPLSTGEDTLIADILAHAAYLHRQHADLPLILFGHSMGSFIARLSLARDTDHLFHAAVICGTGGPNPAAGFGIFLQKTISLFRGERHFSNVLYALMFSANNQKIPDAASSFAWLSRDPAQVKAYEENPLCGFPFTTSALCVLTCLLRDANRKRTFAAVRKDLPLLLISGDADPIGNYGKGVETVRRRFEEAGIRDLTCTVYPGARHELLNEINRETVMQDILAWCMERTAQ